MKPNRYFIGDQKEIEHLIRPYVNEISYRSEWINYSYDDIIDSLNNKNAIDVRNIMRLAMDLIGHAVVIERIITGKGALKSERNRANERAKVLKELYPSIRFTISPIGLNQVRNHYEHFDTKLDEWAVQSNNKNFVDMNVMPANAVIGPSIQDRLRSLDPNTMDLIFWNKKVNLLDCVKWANKLKVEVNKPAFKGGFYSSTLFDRKNVR